MPARPEAMPPAPPERLGMSSSRFRGGALAPALAFPPEDLPYQDTSVTTGIPLNLENSFLSSANLLFIWSGGTPNMPAMPRPQRPDSSLDRSRPILAAKAFPKVNSASRRALSSPVSG